MGDRGGFGRGFGGGRGDRGGFRGRRGRRGRGPEEKEEWVPCTKLGRLVNANRIDKIEDIYLHSLPIKEHQIIDHFYDKPPMGTGDEAPPPGSNYVKDCVMKIVPVQKQTRAGQRTRFKAYILVGDGNGHVGVGVKCAKEVATAIRGGIIAAKLAFIPVRRGYWGNRIGKPHTVPMKVRGKCGSVRVRLVPAPRGTGIVGAPITKRVLQFAGVGDCFTSSSGQTKTGGNFMIAVYDALCQTYGYLTPDLWKRMKFSEHPLEAYSEFLSQKKIDVGDK